MIAYTAIACDTSQGMSQDEFELAWQQARLVSPIKADEEVLVFPSLAKREADGIVKFTLHVWVYEPEENDIGRRAFVSALESAIELQSDAERRVFKDRVWRFLVDNESRKRVTLRVGRQLFTLPRTSGDGHALVDVEMPAADFGDQSVLPIEVALRPGDDRVMMSRVQLAHGSRLLVSDIDDTIKVSHVRSKRALLRKTFLEDPEVVPGMVELYERLLGPLGHLHFVSSSPYQLFLPLERMCSLAGFRPASFGLKRVRPKGLSVTRLFGNPLESKPRAIVPLFQRFSEATFVLVGDTGEKDPEVYGNLYRQFGARIERILLRDVTQEPRDAVRYQTAMAEVPDSVWQLFADPSEVAVGGV